MIYVSLPDPAATSSAGDQCQGLGLTLLPSPYQYHCAATSTYRLTDGSGWIPVDLSQLSASPPISAWPVDPVNTSSTGQFYTYQTDGTTYELTSALESQKYAPLSSNDGGAYTDLYEAGTNKTLAPDDYFADANAHYGIAIGGLAVTVTTAAANVTSTLTFRGLAGQIITIDYNEASGGGCVTVNIVHPDGTETLDNESCVTNNSATTRGPMTLPLTGTYKIVLSAGGENTNRSAGAYTRCAAGGARSTAS